MKGQLLKPFPEQRKVILHPNLVATTAFAILQVCPLTLPSSLQQCLGKVHRAHKIQHCLGGGGGGRRGKESVLFLLCLSVPRLFTSIVGVRWFVYCKVRNLPKMPYPCFKPMTFLFEFHIWLCDISQAMASNWFCVQVKNFRDPSFSRYHLLPLGAFA